MAKVDETVSSGRFRLFTPASLDRFADRSMPNPPIGRDGTRDVTDPGACPLIHHEGMTTTQRIAAALLAIITIPAGIAPVAAAETETETETQTETPPAGGSCAAGTSTTDPEEMTDEEILAETAAVDQQIGAETDARNATNDAGERKEHQNEINRLGRRRSDLKNGWRNNDGKKATERSGDDFEDALTKSMNGEPCIAMPGDHDPHHPRY